MWQTKRAQLTTKRHTHCLQVTRRPSRKRSLMVLTFQKHFGPKTLWKKMSRKDQVAFCGKCRAKHNGVPESTLVASHLPPQYNRVHHGQVLQDDQGNRYKVISRPELKDESSTSTISSNSSNLQRATQLVRWAANIVTYQLSPTVGIEYIMARSYRMNKGTATK